MTPKQPYKMVVKDDINDAYVNGGYTGLMALAERLLAEREAYREGLIGVIDRNLSVAMGCGPYTTKAEQIADAEAARILGEK